MSIYSGSLLCDCCKSIGFHLELTRQHRISLEGPHIVSEEIWVNIDDSDLHCRDRVRPIGTANISSRGEFAQNVGA